MIASRVRPTLLSDTPASDGGGSSSPDHDDPATLPVALARLHWATPVGGRVTVEGPPDRLADLVTGSGFDLERLTHEGTRATARRARTLPDTVGPGMRLLVCGLNPSLVAADAGYGYAGATNRFWPAAAAAGLVTAVRDPLHALLTDGVGMTDLVKRATPSARELTSDEYRAGTERVERLVAWLAPAAVLFVGLAGWRAAVDRSAVAGWQPVRFGGRPAYVMPSTSGLNAHATLAVLVEHMEAAAAV
jgi:TDG/mug DNA glycosylase family protein